MSKFAPVDEPLQDVLDLAFTLGFDDWIVLNAGSTFRTRRS
ncbi:MAG: hypothetical protein R2845_09345 [Thermomicrobiales bacterium]